MNTDFNEWANLPITLSPDEISDPFLVIEDFFSTDDLAGHLKDLQKWRDRVVGHGYYTDVKGNPSSLLFTHQLNLKLIEAAFILTKTSFRDSTAQFMTTDTSEVDEERRLLNDYLQILERVEILNPLLVVNAFFRCYDLAGYRSHLYEWLTYGLSNRSANEFVETTDLISVFENLQRLYSAMWVLYSRKQRDSLAVKNRISEKPVITTRLYQLDPIDTAHDREKLSRIISIIKHKLDSVRAVICLGRKPGKPECIFLLALTSDDEKRDAFNLSSMVEESCRPEKVVVLIHYASAVLNAANTGDRFFSRALSCPVVYLSGDLLLPQEISQSFNFDLSEANWDRWLKQGKEFLLGAEYYLSVQCNSAALFSLHQCAECILVAIIRTVAGYRINNHNLSRLLGITRLFTGDLTEIFHLDTEEGRKNFNILKEAYINVRYKDTYQPNHISVDALFPVVSNLLATAEALHSQFLTTSFI